MTTPKPILPSKTYDRLSLTSAQQQSLQLRRQLSDRNTRLNQKLDLWQRIIEIESGMSQEDVQRISRLVATEP